MTAPALFADPFQWANDLLRQGKCQEAIAEYRLILERQPEHAEAMGNLGVAHAELGQMEEAIRWYEASLRHRPGFATAWYNRGNALKSLGRFQEAIASYDEALRHDPTLIQSYVNRGLALAKLGRLADAAASYRAAIRLQPHYSEALNNLGLALQYLGRVDDAVDCFDAALRVEPSAAEYRCNRAQALLTRCDFSRGWPEYESRWQFPRYQLPLRPQPWWDGSPLAGRSVLLRHEQGLGDTIQFIRFAKELKRSGAGRITLEAPARLHRLARTASGIDACVNVGDAVEVDLQIPLLSIPSRLKTTLRTIPRETPYLAAEPDRVAQWRGRMPPARVRIGIAWQGNQAYPEDHLRSIPLRHFAPLARIPGVLLVSLQQGPGTEQIAALEKPLGIWEPGPALDADGAFIDTAALMTCLDAIVTSDTSIAHLAGALARPVHIALAIGAEWRWFRDRDDSPWYPSAVLHRQQQAGEWSGVFEQILGDLC